jgi:hypothetical protein
MTDDDSNRLRPGHRGSAERIAARIARIAAAGRPRDEQPATHENDQPESEAQPE